MIPYFDYRPQLRALRGEIEDAMRRVLDSGRLILGPEVLAFEDECARRAGAHGGVGVASGTDALVVALRALDIGAGDEVLTVANAGVPPVAAIRAVGAIPRWVEIDPETLLMDPARLEEAAGPRARAVIAVHLYGQPVAMAEVLAFAARRELAVVEDCAQAQGASYRGRPVGSLGNVGCFSFYPTKTLGAYGDGGMCVSRDAALVARMRMIRMYGYRDDRHAHLEGLNTRLDEIQAAILRVKLSHMDEAVAQRRRIAEVYRAGLAGSGCRFVGETHDSTHVYHLFVVRVADRGSAVQALERQGIGYGIHYPEPVHLMEAYRALGRCEGSLPLTEAACREVLSLPIYPGLSTADAEQVVRALRAAC